MMLIYIVCKNEEEAQAISSRLLSKKLIACANYFPISSMYHWENKLVKDNEFALLVKTIKSKKDEVEKGVLKMHSYAVPCILSFEVGANSAYLAWLEGEVKK